MSDPLVTIITATYNRPEVLRMAIESVILQTLKDWKLIVIGDNCDERTGKVIESFQNKKITYINSPERFGEQSGPNSIGIALADTKYIAFLNHDDIWLQDHLSNGIEFLEKNHHDFYIGGTANSAFIEKSENGIHIHVDKKTTDNRSPMDFYQKKVLSYEPASSWILRKSVTDKIGDWNYYDELYRVPIEDFILRAWRSGAKFFFSNKVSVWYILTHYQKQNDNLSYEYQSEEHQHIHHLLISKTADEIRSLIDVKHKEWLSLAPKTKERLINKTSFGKKRNKPLNYRDKFYLFRKNLVHSLISNVVAAWLFKYTGLDLITMASRFQKEQKGGSIQRAILKRTGEKPAKPNKENIISNIRADKKDL